MGLLDWFGFEDRVLCVVVLAVEGDGWPGPELEDEAYRLFCLVDSGLGRVPCGVCFELGLCLEFEA